MWKQGRTLKYFRQVSKKYINDYNFEGISAKTDAVVTLVKKLKAKGVPIHGIGAQAHLVVGTVPTTFKQNLQRFADLGVDVALTELDVSSVFSRDTAVYSPLALMTPDSSGSSSQLHEARSAGS